VSTSAKGSVFRLVLPGFSAAPGTSDPAGSSRSGAPVLAATAGDD
jgi:hypothetical protein